MAFDPHANLAYATVTTAPSPADSGLTLEVVNADADQFPDPAVSGEYNCTDWAAQEIPIKTNSEILRITAKAAAPSPRDATHTQFTIERAQEGSNARSIVVGDQLALSITKKVVDDIENKFPAGDVVGTSDTQTLTNKTLTSPKINENVALTSTATELNLLDGVTQGATSIEAGAKSQIIFYGSYNVWAAVTSTTIVTLKGADGQDVTAYFPIKRPTGKKLYVFFGGRTSITSGKYLEFRVGGVTTAAMRWTGTGSTANYNTGWVELGTGAPTDGAIFDFVPYSLVESGGTSSAIGRATIMFKYDD